jgi:SH3-like domain-containing protein
MKVWPEPDPQAQPIARFQEPADVSVEEERGAWARIRRSDGWGGWVDGRRLERVGAGPAITPEPEPRPQAEQSPGRQPAAPPVAAGPWSPTHEVPAGGMGAWSAPDPQLQPAARLAERVQLRIDEQRGAWARVTGSNGWTGWVDARRLQPLGAGSTAAAATPEAQRSGTRPGGLAIRLVTAIGAAITGIAVALPWLSPPGGGSSNGFDVPLPFLWDYTSGSDFRLGVVVTILAVLGLAVGLVKQVSARLAAVIGFLTLGVGVAFIIQVSRAVSDNLGLGFGDVLGDWVGFGAWGAIAGGVVMLIGGLLDR